MTKEELKLAIEHRDIVIAIRDVLSRPSGRHFFKYLFKTLGVGDLPEVGLDGAILHGLLGTHRAGMAIFKIACEANVEVAGQLLAEKEKDAIDELRKESSDETGSN